MNLCDYPFDQLKVGMKFYHELPSNCWTITRIYKDSFWFRNDKDKTDDKDKTEMKYPIYKNQLKSLSTVFKIDVIIEGLEL